MHIKLFMRHVVRWIKRISLCVLLFIVVYILSALVLSIIPVSATDKSTEGDIDVYILSNGVHTDMVLPVRTELKDWSKSIAFQHTKSNDTQMRYIAFGWGDKGFYLETPEWSDLKFSTAFKAMFHLGTSAMHCTFYKQLKEGEHCRKIRLSREAYQNLVDYIENSLSHTYL